METRPHNFQRHFFTAVLLGDMPVEIALTLDIALLLQPERQVACVKIIVPISARIGMLIRRNGSQRFNGLEHAKQRLDGIVTIGPLRKEDQCSGKNGSYAIPKVNHRFNAWRNRHRAPPVASEIYTARVFHSSLLSPGVPTAIVHRL